MTDYDWIVPEQTRWSEWPTRPIMTDLWIKSTRPNARQIAL